MFQKIFLERSIELAQLHSADGTHGPFGAVIVKDDAIIAEGWNSVVASHDPTAHAEVVAIRNAAQKLSTHELTGSEIYASCEPCPMCLSAIYWSRIDTLYYASSAEDASAAGFDDSRLYSEVALSWEKRSLNASQHLREQGKSVFTQWVNNNNRQEY
ncbi:MAG: nucleoside deaminase [Fibrobacterales bacterium]